MVRSDVDSGSETDRSASETGTTVRTFIDWNRPFLPDVSRCLIDRYGSEGQLDLRQVVVVLPGERAARRMLELLIEQAGEQYPDLIPPRLMTIGRFPELLYPVRRQLADELTQLFVWMKALESVPARKLKPAFPSLPPSTALSARMSVCETVRRQHDELAAEGLDFDELAQLLRQVGQHAEAERWDAMHVMQSEYLMQMDELQLWDRQAARLVAIDRNEIESGLDILLAGTVDMNRVVRRMLCALDQPVQVFVHAPESESEGFDEFGCLHPEYWSDYPIPLRAEQMCVTDSPDDQACEVVAALHALEQEYSADETVIALGDESLTAAIRQHLAQSGAHGNEMLGRPLRQSRPARLMQATAAWLSSSRDGLPPDFDSLNDLVRNPDVCERITAAFERTLPEGSTEQWLAALDRYRADHLQSVPAPVPGASFTERQVLDGVLAELNAVLRPLVLSAAQSAAGQSAGTRSHTAGAKRAGASHQRRSDGRQKTLDFAESDLPADQVTAQLTSRRSLRDWLDGAARFLGQMYGDRSLGDSETDEGIRLCFDAVLEIRSTVRGLPESVLPECTCGDALRLILDQISDRAARPVRRPDGIDMIGWLDLASDDSPCAILTGLNEGSIPQSLNADVFLPNSIRARLGLRDNLRRYARDAYSLLTVLHSRPEVVVIAGRRDRDGNPLVPSRLWFATDRDALPDRVLSFFDPADEQTDVDSPAADTPPRQARRTSGFIVPPPRPVPSRPVEIAVTSFRAYLNCPYRYFLQRELRLQGAEEEVREMTASSFGSLCHIVLEEFGRSPVRHSTDEAAIAQELLKMLHRQAEHQFGRIRTATVAVQLQMLEARLRAFAGWQATTAKEGWRIVHTESSLKYEDFRDIHGRSVVLTGRVDRIEQHQNTKRWRVMDYKTSEAAESPAKTHMQKGEWTDLQLPLYRLLVRSLDITDEPALGFVHLPGDPAKIGDSMAAWELSDLESAEQRAREVAADILDLVIDRVEPGDDDRRTDIGRVCQDGVLDRPIPWLDAARKAGSRFRPPSDAAADTDSASAEVL